MRRLLPLVLLLVAAPAHAVTLEKGVDVQGLAPGGERVVTTNAFGAVLSQALDPRSPPSVVLPLDRCNTQEGADIAASDRLVAVASPCEHEDGTGRPPVAGPLGGPLRALAACAAGRDGIATADTRVAFIDRCGGGGPVAVVRDVTTGAQQRVAIGGANVSTVRLRLAGATLVTVAGIPGATVALRAVDLATGATRTAYDSDIVDADVGADGSVALLRRDRAVPCGARLLVAQPAQASPIGVVDCVRPLGVRVAGGRAAYVGRDGIELFDLRTGGRTSRGAIAEGVTGPDRTRLAFDGRRVVYAIPSCSVADDLVLDDLSGAPPARVAAGCPIAIPPQSPRLRRGSATLRVRCPEGCRGLMVTIRQGRTTHRAHALRAVGLRRGHALVTASLVGRDDRRRSTSRTILLR